MKATDNEVLIKMITQPWYEHRSNGWHPWEDGYLKMSVQIEDIKHSEISDRLHLLHMAIGSDIFRSTSSVKDRCFILGLTLKKSLNRKVYNFVKREGMKAAQAHFNKSYTSIHRRFSLYEKGIN